MWGGGPAGIRAPGLGRGVPSHVQQPCRMNEETEALEWQSQAPQLPRFSLAPVWGPYMLRMCLEMGDSQAGAPCVLDLACPFFSGQGGPMPSRGEGPGNTRCQHGSREGAWAETMAEPWAEFVPCTPTVPHGLTLNSRSRQLCGNTSSRKPTRLPTPSDLLLCSDRSWS